MPFLPGLQGWIESHINFIPRETSSFCGDLSGVEMLDIGGGDMIADIGLLPLGIKHITTLDVLERNWNVVEHAANEIKKAGFPVADDYLSLLKYLAYTEPGFRFPTIISTSCFRGRLLNTSAMCRQYFARPGELSSRGDAYSFRSIHGSTASPLVISPTSSKSLSSI